MNNRIPSSLDSEHLLILRERARLLARVPESVAATAGSLEVLEFQLGAEHYAVETRYVREVYPLRNLTPIPCTPHFVRGVVNVRGHILPVLDLERFLGLTGNGVTDLHRVILVGGNGLELGLLADLSVGVRKIPSESLQAALTTWTGIGAGFIRGVTVDRLVVLDMNRVLSDPRIIVHEEVTH